MEIHNLTTHLPEGSIFVTFVDECCLHHDSTNAEGDEKMVYGHLFYNPNKKEFLFFSTYDENYDNEDSLHITTAVDGFDPQNPTTEQADLVLDFRYCSSVEEGDECTLEDIWFVNDSSQVTHTQTIKLLRDCNI